MTRRPGAALLDNHSGMLPEAGCDEAGRGCLAGPVAAAAVILPPGFDHPDLNDSKKLSEAQRERLRPVIEAQALAWAVAFVDNREIDRTNILRASIAAMHRALDQLALRPAFVVVDGNRFVPWRHAPHATIVKGDGLYKSIAAASVLAKTHRDALMARLDTECPGYNWLQNKGYPTADHRAAIERLGRTKYHRLSFKSTDRQLSFDF